MKTLTVTCLQLLSIASAHADSILLLHGYLGSTQQWKHAGIEDQLNSAGWSNAGALQFKNDAVIASSNNNLFTRRFYTLQLLSDQPIEKQAAQLNHYVEYVRRTHLNEQIIFVGHSAGGVVARMHMVEKPNTDLIALVTIASPHLGTNSAELAQIVSQTLLAWLEPIPGIGQLYPSQGIFHDLMPNRSDNLIAWLNYQEHPNVRYYSIVRDAAKDHSSTNFPIQDYIVPSWSQDMNAVFALRGRSNTYTIKGLHGLSKKDGEVLQKILLNLYSI